MASAMSIAVPGQLLGPANEYIPGPGVHIHNSNLYASILGPITKTLPPKPLGPQKRLTKITPVAPIPLPTLSIERSISVSSAKDGNTKSEILPEVNSTVLCRVTRITPRQASVAILVVGETVLDGEWQGLIRVQDVRATEKDKVKIFESFRPGDIVRAIVVCRQISIVSLRLLIIYARSPWATSRIITFPLPVTTSASLWLRVRQAMQCTLLVGRSTEIQKQVPVRAGKSQSRFEVLSASTQMKSIWQHSVRR